MSGLHKQKFRDSFRGCQRIVRQLMFFAVWCEQEKPWLLIRMFVLQLASRDVDQCVRTLGFEIGYDTTGHRAPVSLPLSFRVSNGQVGMRGRQQDRRTREGGRGE
jgi:hypothetical protein